MTSIEELTSDDVYDVICTDPPWKQTKSVKAVRPNQKRNFDYDLMSLSEIEDFHSRVLTNHTSEQHNVFMWTIEKYLRDAEDIMKRLGYQLHVRLVWDKITGIPSAYTVRFSHEYLLWFYRRGKMLMPVKEMQGKYGSVIRDPASTRRKHSEKPQCVFDILEAMFPSTRRLELFSRKPRDGWDVLGNQIEKESM